ncbi:F-box/LRR-repeat protein 3 [Pyrus ussuriensis x Pyrus communis]|uniref:F-box/LRR-repeat protein 3 n=1 Tax=Pyrus ussuriensis x Pyrus communis TaxID=2448454 RepID=A0A5N5HJ57_9ROSA|nr:F-box/LRR-repeat protein 3 [Pyrus ussuriensis x Pyrus communis]
MFRATCIVSPVTLALADSLEKLPTLQSIKLDGCLVTCAQWLCSLPVLNGDGGAPSSVSSRLALPRVRYSGHLDQNQRRASLTAVKRLAGLQTRRLTLCLKLWLLLHLRHGCCL